MKPSIIYCDMDGVLADFDKVYEELTGESKPVILNKTDQDFWQQITLYRIKTMKGWFDNLPLMSGAHMLWEFINSLNVPVAILTATGMDRERAVEEKSIWVDLNLSDNPLILFVNSGKEKGRYATKNAILIDDTPKCVRAFRNAGGIAILHTSTEDTIKQLKTIMKREDPR